MDTDCVFSQEGKYRVEFTFEECSLEELHAVFADVGAELRSALVELMRQGNRFGSTIAGDLKELMHEGVYSPVSALLDSANMNCRLFAHAWDNFSGGMCFEVIGAITKQTFIVILEGILSLMMMFLLFGIWRYFIDNRVAWKQQQREAFARASSGQTALARKLSKSLDFDGGSPRFDESPRERNTRRASMSRDAPPQEADAPRALAL
jgi:hypothetical protein